jgi:hypothetical protein
MVEGPLDPQPPEPTSFSAFDHLLDTCRRTHAALHAVVHDEARDGIALRDQLAREALAHVEAILEGLVLRAHAGGFSPEELRALVRRAGIVGPASAGSPEARAALYEAAYDRPALRAVDGRSMLAAGHARVVFSLIPSLPAGDVSWPRHPRSYADILPPHTETELLLRAEELARVVWRVAVGDERRDEPLRRTLAFYEAGSRLTFHGFRAA